MPQAPADDWSLNEWRSHSTPERRLFRKNLSASIAQWRSTHGYLAYLSFAYQSKDASGLPSTGDLDVLIGIEESELDFLTDRGLAVLVAVVTVSGVRDFLFYTHSPEEFLDRAGVVGARHPHFRPGCQIAPDPTWSQYDDLP